MYVCVDKMVVYLAWCATCWAEFADGVGDAVAVVGDVANWAAAADDDSDAVGDVGSCCGSGGGVSAESGYWTDESCVGGTTAPVGYVVA